MNYIFIIISFPAPGRMYESIIENFSSLPGYESLKDLTLTEYISYLVRGNYLHDARTAKEKLLQKWILENCDEIFTMNGFNPEDFVAGRYSVSTEMRDFLLESILIDEWGKNKQAYKPDPDFAEALIQTDGILLTKDMIEHLPSKSFYIDFSECKSFAPATGAFVFYFPITDVDGSQGYSFCIYLLRAENKTLFSYYWGGKVNEKGELDVNTAELKEHPFEMAPNAINLTLTPEEQAGYGRKKISLFAMQLISYLYIKEPDLEESPITKSTYKKPLPGAKPKNKFSEVQQWDIGTHYGATFRENKKKDAVHYEITEEGRRKSPNPHFRRAHWQHYWTGAGRKKYEVRWIEPIFVSGTGNAKDVVIHKVK